MTRLLLICTEGGNLSLSQEPQLLQAESKSLAAILLRFVVPESSR